MHAPWVWRDGRRAEDGPALRDEVVRAARSALTAAGEARRRAALHALVTAGELEAGIADAHEATARAPDPDPTFARATDALASLVLGRDDGAARVVDALARAHVPQRLVVTPPEGFAYYALAPEAYAEAAVAELEARGARAALVVGIRSIGTTLSAIAAEALRRREAVATRITVRPSGPPSARRFVVAEAPASVQDAVARARTEGAHVLVVDEGPGQSGSTFLAVAEGLAGAGIPCGRITIVCSHPPDHAALGASRAQERWRMFHERVAPSETRTPDAREELSAGRWRMHLYARDGEDAWPAVWLQSERRKLLSRDGARLLKYEGLGRTGAEARVRAERLAEAGFGLPVRDEGDGFCSTRFRGDARPLRAEDLDAHVLETLARMCATRDATCPATRPAEDLAPVVAKNLAAVFGSVPRTPLALGVVRPAVVDGRLAPHEWLHDGERLVKTDGATHGDDHFFPGPTDVAWDLAGAIVEWGMPETARATLLERYRALTGDDARARIDTWVVAYATTRAATMVVAENGYASHPEHPRLVRALARYRDEAARAIARADVELARAEPYLT